MLAHKAGEVGTSGREEAYSPASHNHFLEAAGNLSVVKTDDDLKQLLKKSGNRPVVVNFGASWCEHCKLMVPELAKISKEFPKPLYVVADVDLLPETSKHVKYTPTFTVFHRSRKIDEFWGSNVQKLRDHIWLHEDLCDPPLPKAVPAKR
ncbi:hypothetical protein KFL_008390050 [Klebsormidium nitens]|uniref:Thioredoxin domain-containing protein n=1 Tax=Klebsormidium nitens TaxID=105231 RepID=A0A1Y1INQ8_KLENI|nr:hypothetical protein KFL_008390050 [Klebsormidium nitens]|eukprot:GAQ91722.1 hypothetical protein KFL_008390050 [Klebsormidium nitens]